jgi:hypothetical protein
MALATDPKHFMDTQTAYKTQKPLYADITSNQPFYMVVRLGSNGCQQADSAPSVRYDDMIEAGEEAKRLASKYPNHPRGFAVVKALYIYKANVAITRNCLEEKPFKSLNTAEF